MFDPNAFAEGAVDAPMSTTPPVCPEGEYVFMLDSDPAMLVPKELKGTSGRTGKDYHFWQLPLMAICQDSAVKEKMKRDTLKVRCFINLDLDDGGRPETGEGKNVALGRLREALGQNKPGWKPKDLLGAGPFIGRVKHTQGKNPGDVYADITNTTKVS